MTTDWSKGPFKYQYVELSNVHPLGVISVHNGIEMMGAVDIDGTRHFLDDGDVLEFDEDCKPVSLIKSWNLKP
jgi:hypothetical protein